MLWPALFYGTLFFLLLYPLINTMPMELPVHEFFVGTQLLVNI